MASSILLRNIGGTDDKRIVLSNSQFARVMDIGTTWTRVRVGIRFCVRDTGGSLASTPRLFVGLSSGTSNLFGDATTQHALGVWTANPSWVRATSPTRYLLGNNPSWNSVKRVGTTNTTSSTGLPSETYILSTPETGGRGVQFVDITKGSPNFTIGAFQRFQFSGGIDVSLTEFLTQMEVASPSLTDHQFTNASTLAVDEAVDGFFNAVHVYWDRSTPEIEISDLAYARLA